MNPQQQQEYEQARDAQWPVYKTPDDNKKRITVRGFRIAAKEAADWSRSYTIRQMEGEWISVKDKMPGDEYGMYQIVWCEFEDPDYFNHVIVAYESEGSWWTSEKELENVTHWRPMLQPPIYFK